MDNNFLVAPGTILKEYMDARNIKQKDLALKANRSEKYISELINGKAKLSEEMALVLEGIFPDLNAKIWLNLENDYRLKLLRNEHRVDNEIKVISKEYQFNHVFKNLKYSLNRKASEMLRILGVSSFEEAEDRIDKLSYNFMEDGGNKKAIFVWLKLCEYEIDIQNEIDKLPDVDINGLINSMGLLKSLINTVDFELAIKNIRRLLNKYGIPFVVMPAIPSSKVRGATSKIDDRPVIFLSTRFNRLDTFYFALVHELEHVFTNDYQNEYFITFPEEEQEFISNKNARRFFVDLEKYNNLVSKVISNKTNIDVEIISFANMQKVIPDIVIGFLEHDKIIEYGSKNHLKSKIIGR